MSPSTSMAVENYYNNINFENGPLFVCIPSHNSEVSSEQNQLENPQLETKKNQEENQISELQKIENNMLFCDVKSNEGNLRQEKMQVNQDCHQIIISTLDSEKSDGAYDLYKLDDNNTNFVAEEIVSKTDGQEMIKSGPRMITDDHGTISDPDYVPSEHSGSDSDVEQVSRFYFIGNTNYTYIKIYLSYTDFLSDLRTAHNS